MKKLLFFSVLALYALLFSSCVESSKKYKTLLAQMDSLSVSSAAKNAEFEEVFATLNEVEEGLKSIREAENILVLQSQKGGAEVTATSRERLKSDVAAIGEAIANYKTQIDNLKRDNRIKSDQFKKRLAAITQELEAKSQLVDDLSRQLAEKENQLKVKTQQIATLDQTVSNLRHDVESLNKESTSQKETISTQDVKLNTAFYIVGTKAELIAANVMSKGGLFRSAKISYQAEQSAFIKIDIREVTDISLNSKKAKVMSVHPDGTFTLEPDASGMLVLKITNPKSFWEHTKYLVIQNQ
jgi:predicted RNase H-like nuclease (RuvC/YqgF family)